MKRDEILKYFEEGCRLLQEEISTEELTDYAREQSFYCVCSAIKFIKDNEDVIF